MPSLFPTSYPFTLPQAKTLLLKGPYHASAPIHFCLSFIKENPGAKAVFLSPSRHSLTTTLQEYNDDWIATHSGRGTNSGLSSRITTFYPPTPAHLVFILSTLRTSSPSDGASFLPKTTFDVTPSLIVLHEPSQYFIDAHSEGTSYGLSSYLTLISQSLDAVAYLATNSGVSPSFALFDSRLDQLRLPVLKPSLQRQDQASRTESVSFLAQKFFDWVATFESHGEQKEPAQRLERRMRMHRVGDEESEDSSWQWMENPGPERGGSDRRGIVFSWW